MTESSDCLEIEGVTKSESTTDGDGLRSSTASHDVINKLMQNSSHEVCLRISSTSSAISIFGFVLQAEARLWAKRQARAEAREIRMRELERQQKEQEENADRQFDMLAEPTTRPGRTSTTGSRYLSSRRSSEDSLEDGGSLRDLKVKVL